FYSHATGRRVALTGITFTSVALPRGNSSEPRVGPSKVSSSPVLLSVSRAARCIAPGPAAGRWLPHGDLQRVERSFCLSQQHIRPVIELAGLLHQASRRLARRLRPASDFRWQHRAAVQMRPDAVGQIRVTPRAHVGTHAKRIRWRHLSRAELSPTTNALSNSGVPTVDNEKNTRSTTIE